MLKVNGAMALRQRLADKLRREGVLRDPAVERAVRVVPRHFFSPATPLERAYDDRVIRLKEDGGVLISSLSQPAMIVEMLQQLDVRAGNRILEIGTGSGYTAALLGELTGSTGRVVSIDLEADLVDEANGRFAALGMAQVSALTRDGSQGDAESAPFNRILLTACATDIERAWWDQLAPGGRMVLPLSFNGVQKSVAFFEDAGILRSDSAIDCGFVMVRGSGQTEYIQRLSEDPDLFLSADGAADIDAPAIGRRLLVEEPVWQHLPADVIIKDFYSGAMLWMALHDQRFCRIETSVESTLQIPMLFAPSGSRLTIGLCERDSIALLGYRAAPRAQGLFVAAYGPDCGLAARIEELLVQWERNARPGKRGLAITAVRSGGSLPAQEFTAMIKRPQTTFSLLMK